MTAALEAIFFRTYEASMGFSCHSTSQSGSKTFSGPFTGGIGVSAVDPSRRCGPQSHGSKSSRPLRLRLEPCYRCTSHGKDLARRPAQTLHGVSSSRYWYAFAVTEFRCGTAYQLSQHAREADRRLSITRSYAGTIDEKIYQRQLAKGHLASAMRPKQAARGPMFSR